ncbi:MAG: class I adenylate-forming enzyme family protein, partial [Rhodoglobus sp.]|nr:class I adenylate-forming enzyme family protein [Rhodoglobus sp.]
MEPRTVPELIERTYRRYGDRRAVLGRSGWLTFSEVEHESARAAGAIANAGAAPGDRIVLAVDSGPQARILEYAILGHGFVRVAVSTRLHPREIADIAVDCGATVVFGGEVLRSALEDAGSTAALLDPDARGNPQSVPDVSPADTTMLIYSGGSTGISKGAIVSNAAWIAHTNASLSILPDVDPDDTVLAVAQLPYLGGSIAFDCATAGASTVFLARFSAAKVIDAVVRYGITVLPLASTMLELLAAELDQSGRRLPELRVVPYGGSPIRPDALDRAARLLPSTLVQYYGLAEALAPLVSLSAADHDQAIASGDHTRLRSAGRWLDGIQHRIDNDELLVRGEVVMPGYANRGPAAPLDAQGWFRTGDIVSEDDDGFLYITGRSNDIIMSGGFNVHPS